MNQEMIDVDGVFISKEYTDNPTVMETIIPNRKKLPYYKALQRYLRGELLKDHPELESEYIRKIEILGLEDQIITEAFLFIIEYSKDLLQNSDVKTHDLPELELQKGFEFLKDQFIN